MANGGGTRGRSGGRRPSPAPRSSPRPPSPVAPRKPPKPELPAPGPPRVFTLGVVPGATPGKWVALWRERMPRVELVLRAIAVDEQAEELSTGAVDAALVRLPLERDGLSVIRLYDETPVAIVGADSHLTAADELDLADLAGEVLIVPRDDVLGVQVPGTLSPAFDPPADTEEALALVAAGAGVVLAPMSLARLHARKDLASRPVRDAPVSTMALAWPADATTPDVEAFVGIVRGRTARSSR